MKITSIIALALLAGSGLAYSQQPAPEAPARQQQAKPQVSVPKADAWANCPELEKRLTNSVLRALKGTDKKSVQAFLAVPKNRLTLAHWALAHRENKVDAEKVAAKREGIRGNISRRQESIEKLKQRMASARGADREAYMKRGKNEQAALKNMEKELKSALTMKEALAASPKAAGILRQMTSDPEWMEQLLYTGECDNPGRVLAILTAIVEKSPDALNDKMSRALATATALEWARMGGAVDSGVERALFFIDNNKANRFHSGFRSLPFWQLRLLCGSKAENEHASIEGLRWALENVHLPADQYTGCCWQGAYQEYNLFGDTIHGPYYYDVYGDIYGSNALQRTRDVGGVCGSLSHYGACCAQANGVPALPAGEPEHCSYIVMVNGKWTPAYSLSWDRALHWSIWNHVDAYSTLHAGSDVYDKHGKNADKALSDAYGTLGQVLASKGKKEEALACLSKAANQQPLNFTAWRNYAEYLRDNEPDNAAAWKELTSSMCKGLSPKYPELTARLMRAQVYPNIKGLAPAEQSAIVNEFWKSVREMGPDRWHIEVLCNEQLKLLKESGAADASTLYGQILENTKDKPAYAPIILAWGNSLASGMDEAAQKRFMKSTIKALSAGGAGGTSPDDRDRMLGQVLRGAAATHDRSSFQAVGKLLSEKYRNPAEKLPKWEPFPGTLVSQGGLLRVSSTCNFDNPASHWGVLEPVGGGFHTDKVENPYAEVELPKTAYLSGVVTVAPEGNLGRLKGMKVQYSESGQDGDWHDAGEMPSPTASRTSRLDLQKLNPRARFIRILRPGGPEYFHLKGIFVYGKPAA